VYLRKKKDIEKITEKEQKVIDYLDEFDTNVNNNPDDYG